MLRKTQELLSAVGYKQLSQANPTNPTNPTNQIAEAGEESLHDRRDQVSNRLFEIKIEKAEIERSSNLRAQLIEALTDQLNDIDRREELCEVEKQLEKQEQRLDESIYRQSDKDFEDKRILNEEQQREEKSFSTKPVKPTPRKTKGKRKTNKKAAKQPIPAIPSEPRKSMAKAIKKSKRLISVLPEESRQRIVEAQKRRWDRVKKQKYEQIKKEAVKPIRSSTYEKSLSSLASKAAKY